MDLLNLSLADKCCRVDSISILAYARDDLRPGRVRQECQLVQVLFRLFAPDRPRRNAHDHAPFFAALLEFYHAMAPVEVFVLMNEQPGVR